ncbi:hypothetical protein [Nocardia tengchongensis]|uniref:hypothetical protein n=1 Tax=Nocardia tengchongensis TaxID=2055889 RepID=UPI00368C7EF6
MDIVTESAPFTTPCIQCRAPTTSTVTEALVGEDHRWDIDGDCSSCGATWADCGYQQPLTGFREAILTANGPTVLELGVTSSSLATVMRALRLTRSMSPAQAKAIAEELRETGLEGTRIEMEILARLLRDSGVPVNVRTGQRR